MRSLWKNQQKNLEFRTIAEPMIKSPDDVLIKVKYCSISDQDLRMFRTGDYRSREGIAGYNMAGEIVSLGAHAAEQGFQAGDRVAASFVKYCGKCKFCRKNLENRCVNITSSSGVLSEYVTRSYSQLLRLPDALTYKAGSLIEMVAEVVEAVEKLDIKLNDIVVILGGGFTGCVAVSLCRKRGAGKIVVLDSSEMRRAAAAEMGADICIDPADEQFQIKMLEATDFDGFDVILETSYDSELFHRTVEYIARGGKICTVTYYDMDQNIMLRSSFFYHANVTLMSSFLSNNKHELAAQILQQTDFARFIQVEYPFSRAIEAFSELQEGHRIGIGIVL